MNDKREPYGIGGWLLLPMLGLILTPIRQALVLFGTFLPIFTNGTWERVTSTASPVYHPLLGPLIVMEVLGNLGLMVAALTLLVLMFMKHPWFPRLMIGYLSFSLVFVAVDLLFCYQIELLASQDHSKAFQELVRSMMGCAIWIPYFLVSRRVKNTFGGERAAASPSVEAARTEG